MPRPVQPHYLTSHFIYLAITATTHTQLNCLLGVGASDLPKSIIPNSSADPGSSTGTRLQRGFQCNPAAEAYAARGPTHKLSADCAGELHPVVQKLLFSFFPRDRVDSLTAGVQLTHAAQRTPDPKIFREGSRGFVSVAEQI